MNGSRETSKMIGQAINKLVVSVSIVMAVLQSCRFDAQAADQPASWMIGRRVNGEVIAKGIKRPIEIVRLSDKSLVYRDPAKKGSKNVRIDVTEKPFDELQADGKVWKLVKSQGESSYQGPTIPAKAAPVIKLVRDEHWTDEQLVHLVALCYWSRYIDLLREFEANGENAKTSWWLKDLSSKGDLLQQLKDPKAYELGRQLRSVAGDLSELTRIRNGNRKKIEQEIANLRERIAKANAQKQAVEEVSLDAVLRMFQFGLGLYAYDDSDDVGMVGRALNEFASQSIGDGLYGLAFDGLALSWLGMQQSLAGRIDDQELQEVITEAAKELDEKIDSYKKQRSNFLARHLDFDVLDVQEKIRSQTLTESREKPLNQLDLALGDRVSRVEAKLKRTCPLPRIERLGASRYNSPNAARLRELANKVAAESRLWPKHSAFDRDVSDTLFYAAILKLEAALIEEDPNCWRDCFSVDAEYAVALLNAALSVGPNDPLGSRRHLLAIAHFLAGNFGEAERQCVALASSMGDDPQFLFLRGRLRCASGTMAEGIADLEQAVAQGFRGVETARHAVEFQQVKDKLKEKLTQLTALNVTMERVGQAGFGLNSSSRFHIVNRSAFALTNLRIEFVYQKWEGAGNRMQRKEEKIKDRFPVLDPNQFLVMTIDPQQQPNLDPRTKSYGELRIRTDQQGGLNIKVTEESLRPKK